MERRKFLRLAVVMGSMAMMPKYIYASEIDLGKISFNEGSFNENRQTIIIFLSGAPSPLSANLTNLAEINKSSQNNYQAHFGSYLSEMEYGLWKEAGGTYMKNMLDNNEMTIFRTCYSETRERTNNKAHGVCTQQNMNGNYDTNKAGGLSNLERIMKLNNVYSDAALQFITLTGINGFHKGDDDQTGVNPISINYNLSNPFDRRMTSGVFYTNQERKDKKYAEKDPALNLIFDTEAKTHNKGFLMNNFIENRRRIDAKIKTVSSERNNGSGGDKNLSLYGYTENSRFHKTLATAVELLDNNPTTKIITMGTAGLGGWDDHSFCRINYTRRMSDLFKGLEASMRHLDGLGKKNSVSIIVYGEFGRNVNLNTAFGWDHGNLQNLFVLGGTDYYNHFGGEKSIIGETIVDNEGRPKSGRLWLKPKEGSYVVDPLSVMATIHYINGVENPEVLTEGYGVINPNIDGEDFLKV